MTYHVENEAETRRYRNGAFRVLENPGHKDPHDDVIRGSDDKQARRAVRGVINQARKDPIPESEAVHV